MAHVRFHETHSPSPTGTHTRAHTAKQVVFGVGVVSLPSERFTRFGNPAWPGVRTANFAAFEPWLGVLPKNAESLRNSDALMRVAVPRRRSPAGLRDLFRFCRNRDLYIRRSWFSACARWGWYYYPRSVSHGSEPLRGRDLKRQTLPLLGLGRGAPEERRKPAGQRCAYARRCSEVPRPRWAAHTYAGNTSIFPAEFFSHSQKAGKKSHSLMFHIHVFDCTA